MQEEREDRSTKKLQRKQELQVLLKQEEQTIQASDKSKQDLSIKLTRSQINMNITELINKSEVAQNNNAWDSKTPLVESPVKILQENLNRIESDQEHAHGIDQALLALNSDYAGKSSRSTYTLFEEQNLDRLKRENPSLRLSQIKQLLRKEWSKSPMNPLNR
ncbi:hypothetical protein GJ496_003173 [Pomphorhynchus laevis]|nr:hypothetical protein GJ496_003173 [Pomphorhynchus laevis]